MSLHKIDKTFLILFQSFLEFGIPIKYFYYSLMINCI